MSAAGLKFWLTSASSVGAIQKNVRASLGGKQSISPAVSLSFRRTQAMRGVKVIEFSANCEPGTANITAASSGSLTFTAPGSATAGTAVAIANLETVTLYDGVSASKWVTVKRTTSDGLAGNEAILLLDTYENVWSGQRFSTAEAAAGEHDYAGLIIENASGAEITGLKLWLSSTMTGLMRIAKEAVVSGAIQTIASRTTAPTGVAWVTGTSYAAGLDIGTLADGAFYGLWRDVYVNAGAAYNPAVDCTIHYQFTRTAVTYTGQQRGLTRIQGTARHELFIGTAKPDPLVDTAKATGTPPLTWAGPYTPSTRYYWTLCKRNSWGVLDAVGQAGSVWVNALGDEGYVPPQGPAEASLTPAAEGFVTLSIAYYRAQEEDPDATAAIGFAWWITYDGTTPSTAGAPTSIAAFATPGASRSHHTATLGPYVDQAPVKVIVRTYRTDGVGGVDTVYSENTNVITCTANALGPARAIGRVAQGRSAGIWIQPNTAPVAVETIIDAFLNARWIMSAGSAALYVDSDLMWRILYNSENTTERGRWYIPLGVTEPELLSAAGNSDPVAYEGEVEKRFYFHVNSIRRMKFEGGTTPPSLTCAGIDTTATMPDVYPQVPAWCRYADTLFTVWDRATENYVVWGQLTSAGMMNTCIPVDMTLTAAEIAALEVP